MPFLHRAVLLRAAAAAVVLATALGVEAAAGHALARRGVERAERDSLACAAAARAAAELRADHPVTAGGRPSDDGLRVPGCPPRGRAIRSGVRDMTVQNITR
ncbi:hypothetical protein [Kitasatospora sp. NPDC059571]|uniref:hypothetical protein n=1 Tax=Kitasatospora sp. NPDC059571 TaxID=3346871 RepID=UPI0036B6F1A4